MSDEPAVGTSMAGASLDLSDEALRGALELAFAVAVAGARLRPPTAPPPGLKRFMKFSKLPTGALAPVRRALEDDPAFRERTARIATEELAGRLGVLWLTRPDGWEAHAAPLVEVDAPNESGSARSETRRREAAEQALARLRGEFDAAQTDLRRLTTVSAEATRRVAQAEAERDRARRERDELVSGTERQRRRAEQAEDLAARLRAELAEAHQRITALESMRDDALTARQTAEDLLAVVATEGGLPPGPPSPTPPAAPATPLVATGLDPVVVGAAAALAERIHDVAASLGALGTELAGALETIAGTLPARREGGASVGTPPALSGPVSFPPPGTVPLGSHRRVGQRRPMSVPAGLAMESETAALHVIRQPGVVTVVDGYNVAKLGWPLLELAEQRRSCLDGLEDLVRRFGVRFQVVFDGADVGSAVLSGRRLVRVRFTTAGVTADEEIRGLVRALPPDQQVVVVSNDREVVRDSRRAGANTIASDQLVSLIRSR